MGRLDYNLHDVLMNDARRKVLIFDRDETD